MSETPMMDDVACRSMGRDIEPEDYYAALETGRYLEKQLATARADALEECAKIAETPMSGEQDDITREACDGIARRIRSLKEKK